MPVAVKLSPVYSSLGHFAARAVAAGADGLVLFNRFYQPDLDVDTLDVVPRLELSSPWELRLPLRWIAILRPSLDGRASLAATWASTTGTDVAKALLVGADVAMTTSAVLRHGPEHIAPLEEELVAWMTDARVRVGRPAARSVSPRHGRRPGRVRAGELRPRAPLLDRLAVVLGARAPCPVSSGSGVAAARPRSDRDQRPARSGPPPVLTGRGTSPRWCW